MLQQIATEKRRIEKTVFANLTSGAKSENIAITRFQQRNAWLHHCLRRTTNLFSPATNKYLD
jgi:hypothetical protein